MLVVGLDDAMDVMMKEVPSIALAQKCACDGDRFLHGGIPGLGTLKVTLLGSGSSYEVLWVDGSDP